MRKREELEEEVEEEMVAVRQYYYCLTCNECNVLNVMQNKSEP